MSLAHSEPRPQLDDVRSRILTDHARIRALLGDLQRLASRLGEAPSAPEGAETQLTEAVWKLFLVFDDHLALEERELVPIILDSGEWATIRADRLREEHSAQRTVLHAMVGECDRKTKDLRELVEDVRWLVTSLLKDMEVEEGELERIRDDGFVPDQCTG